MKRREFLGLTGGAAATFLPVRVYAQKAPMRVGLLASGAEGSLMSRLLIDAIKQGLSEQGLADSRDYVLDARHAAGDYSRFPRMAKELAQAGARVILVNTIASVRAAQGLSPPVPVVMLAINDPVGAGLVAGLAKPGRATTGMATLNEDLTPKLLEFQRAILPNAATIAAVVNPANPTNLTFLNNLRVAAEKIGMTVQPVELKTPSALQPAFSSLAAKRPDVLQIISDSGTLDLSDQIAALALANRIPSFASSTSFAQVGGLLAYGPSRVTMFKRSAYFVKRILEGTNAGDLPVEQPTRIELIVNLRTAKALGLTIPLHLQQLADEVIE
jgi:putative tryptophan/tyrosine transport system substrate-binding protein